MRARARLRPYTIGHLLPGHDAYLPETATLLAQSCRWWTYRGDVRTVQLQTGEYCKGLAGFNDAPSLDAIGAAVEEIRETFGVSFPSGWLVPFRESYRSPVIPWTYNACLLDAFAGGWQQAIKTGFVAGPLYQYDIRSAYLGALAAGLPDPDTYRFTRSLASRPALFRVRLARPEPSAPYPYNTETDVLATGEEIGLYGLDVEEVLAGVAWRRLLDPAPIQAAVQSWSHWKYTARGYWGAWAQSDGVECHVPAKSWELPALATNLVWAHLIVGRVRKQIACQVDAGAAHVFVDSIITSSPHVTTGDEIGAFRLTNTYSRGLHIIGTGWYGEPGQPLAKATGVPLGDARRYVNADGQPAT